MFTYAPWSVPLCGPLSWCDLMSYKLQAWSVWLFWRSPVVFETNAPLPLLSDSYYDKVVHVRSMIKTFFFLYIFDILLLLVLLLFLLCLFVLSISDELWTVHSLALFNI